MAEVVRMLRQEHTDTAILLDLLERQTAEFKRGGAADFGIVRRILDYYLSTRISITTPRRTSSITACAQSRRNRRRA